MYTYSCVVGSEIQVALFIYVWDVITTSDYYFLYIDGMVINASVCTVSSHAHIARVCNISRHWACRGKNTQFPMAIREERRAKCLRPPPRIQFGESHLRGYTS